jgi:hypothetical protein
MSRLVEPDPAVAVGVAGDGRSRADELDLQMRQSLAIQAEALAATQARVDDLESVLYALLGQLVKQGNLDVDALEGTARRLLDHVRSDSPPGFGLELRPSAEDTPASTVQINCAERLPYCRGACCSLDFTLNEAEVRSGNIKWDLTRPYHIRRDNGHFCSHLSDGDSSCSIYDQRPGVCRAYDCSSDERIWLDFEAMKPNEQWISARLSPGRPTSLLVDVPVADPSRRDTTYDDQGGTR